MGPRFLREAGPPIFERDAHRRLAAYPATARFDRASAPVVQPDERDHCGRAGNPTLRIRTLLKLAILLAAGLAGAPVTARCGFQRRHR